MSSSPRQAVPPLLRPPSFHPGMEWHPAAGKPQYVVINPMHIINLHDRTRTFAVRVVEKIKAISERWFTHVLLLLFLFIYASVGALLFQWIEAPVEIGEKSSINRTRELIIQNLWEARNMSNTQWTKVAYQRLKEYEDQLEQHMLSKAPADSEKIVWTFWGSLFYAGTIFTTIGYGNIVPATTTGQAITIVYAFIGIPFLLMVLADLGKLFTRAIKALFFYIKLFYHTGKCRSARRMGRRATAVPAQYMSATWNKMPYMVYQGKKSQENLPAVVVQEKDVESQASKSTETSDKSNDKRAKKEDRKGSKKSNNEEDKQDAIMENEQELEDYAIREEEDEDADDEFNLPVSLAVLLLIAYMMMGAFIFTLWEDWTFFESFYFVFISMSTIGFGDYVPNHPMYMMGAFIYLLFGLALTSMCINVVQEKLSATFEMAKMRIGTTIGLDANILMEEDILPEKTETPDSRRRSSTVKSRRGSKAVPQPSPNRDDADENKSNDETQTKENGLKVDHLSP